MVEEIKLNEAKYWFEAKFASNSIVTDLNNRISSSNPKFLPASISLFDMIEVSENLFARFTKVNLGIGTLGGGIESSILPFSFKSNNTNIFDMTLTNELAGGPKLLNSTRDPNVEHNILSFLGVINSGANIGTEKNISTFNTYECKSIVEANLDEIKINTTIFNFIDRNKTISENLKDILSLVLSDNEIDSASFTRGYTKFPEPYIYPNHFSALDALCFLLPFNLTNDTKGITSQLLISYDRVTRKYKLISPLDAFIDKFTPEQFTITTQSTNEGQNKSPSLFAPANGTFTVRGNNSIDSYFFSDVHYDTSNSKFVTTFITTPNNLTGTSSSLVKLQDEVGNYENAILPLIQSQYGNKAKLNVALDPIKITNSSYRVFRSPYDLKLTTDIVKAQMYNYFMFDNMQLKITVPGQIYRQPGTLIIIDKDRNVSGGEFDKKIIGHWYVMEVKHTFNNKGSYINELYCCKPFIQE